MSSRSTNRLRWRRAAGQPASIPAPGNEAEPETWDDVYSRPDAGLADRRLVKERGGRRWRIFEAQLTRHFGARTLDCVELGCGEGDFSVLLAEGGHRVTLVDFSRTALDRARRRFAGLGLAATFVATDLFTLADTHAASFDVSCSLGVVEHFSGAARQQVVDAHRAVLRPGGLALVSVPHAWCMPYRLWKWWLEVRRLWPYGFEDPFTAREMRHRARRAGFGTCSTYKTGFAASVDGCLLLPITGRRRGWGDGPRWANALAGWDVNLVGEAA